ncbi:hypothetical protein G7Z17_g2536 [Cylindrodendrum hubeiense]|uniref:DNA2/NAM7 helicase-like C-terminal domain-containing protein n=1 Tax=Cylindrodendrum hubeiense TaxID=595255 RepID=A0A9P5LJ04_9HYPO|nr:hypothetical protein G7Z17_g2536 [Cylindrodendrum hubeiense]
MQPQLVFGHVIGLASHFLSVPFVALDGFLSPHFTSFFFNDRARALALASALALALALAVVVAERFRKIFWTRFRVQFYGKALGSPQKIPSRFFRYKPPDSNLWIGFQVEFSLSQGENEDSGFGFRHTYDRHLQSVVPLDQHRVTVKFPRGQCAYDFKEASPELLARFPHAKGAKNGLAYVSVRLNDGACVSVEGFGIPFANALDPEVESWINHDAPIVENVTLLDVLRQNHFHFVVANTAQDALRNFSEDRLPPPFKYPYGTNHTWNTDRIQKLLFDTKDKRQFFPTYHYEDDNAHITVVTQSIIQDIMWVDQAAREIRSIKYSAYFIPLDPVAPADAKRFYMVIPLTKEFRDRFDGAWRRLTKTPTLHVLLFNHPEDKEAEAKWKCSIVGYPQGLTALKSHPTSKQELVLFVRRPPTEQQQGHDFENCAALDFDAQLEDCKRKVDAMDIFQEAAKPTHAIPGNVKDVMDLHRTLMRGNGFFDWMTRPKSDVVEAMAATSLEHTSTPKLRALPVVNFLQVNDDKFVDVLVDEALPVDRGRFRQYLSNRPLGLGIITAGPGFGKTTALAAATLAMQASCGKVFCSGPSNVAIDNFAARIDRITSNVTAKYNKDKQDDALDQTHRRLVVRGYKPQDEMDAFLHLLEKPADGDKAAPHRGFAGTSKWQLHLSIAFWLLVVLRCPTVRALHPDDHPKLHELRRKIDARRDLEGLCAVASGKMAWQDYQQGSPVQRGKLTVLMKEILAAADLFCATPAMTTIAVPYSEWKRTAKAVAVDEAANMVRADLAIVWGNTLLPCFLAGDPKQLPPTILTVTQKDILGNYLNRLPQDGKISPLEFFQAGGVPVYRLRTQLRMAEGLFDAVSAEIYPEVPFKYAPSCQVSLPQFAIGRALESYILAKYADVKPSPTGKLSPIFIHCEGYRVIVNEMTGSKKSHDQVRIALDVAVDFAETKSVDPANFVIISPYTANVELIEKMRRRPAYSALLPMPPASTVDGFQGKEGDIVILVMGTAYPRPGPGFTSEQQRLNVMVTRQRAGLLIVGDINVTGELGTSKGKGKADKEIKTVKSRDSNGKTTWKNVAVLHKLHLTFWNAGRVAHVSGKAKDDGQGADLSS